jgi:hypothetical protein
MAALKGADYSDRRRLATEIVLALAFLSVAP